MVGCMYVLVFEGEADKTHMIYTFLRQFYCNINGTICLGICTWDVNKYVYQGSKGNCLWFYIILKTLANPQNLNLTPSILHTG